MAETDPGSLGAASRLRAEFPPDLAAWALTQAELRSRAESKFPEASRMLFTRTGLEQATRPVVAAWRAERLARAGVTSIVDLGCGIGSDAMAFAAAGLNVMAVDADEETVRCATANLASVGAGPAVQARAEDLEIPDDAAVFLDPARRSARGRSWSIGDYSPSWEFVRQMVESSRPVVVKLGPGFDKQHIPKDLQACWVSHRGDVVEVSLWNRAEPRGFSAVVFGRDDVPTTLDAESPRSPLAVASLGAFVLEPDGAVIRAGLIDAVAPDSSRWLLAEQVAYLSSDEPLVGSPATSFEVLDVMPMELKAIRGALRERGVGSLEIKVRAMDIDPAKFRRQLKLSGTSHATLILARTIDGAKAVLARRWLD